MLRLKTGEIGKNLPAEMMVEGEHLWFEWEMASGKICPTCRWCMACMPRSLERRKGKCRGPVKIELRG